MNRIQHMKNKTKKITVVFMAALLCLFTMPGVALADEGGTWVSFVNGGYLDPGTCIYDGEPNDDGSGLDYFAYILEEGTNFSVNFSESNTYRIRIIDGDSDTGWIDTFNFEIEDIDGILTYHFTNSGSELFVAAMESMCICRYVSYGDLNDSEVTIYIQSFVPDPPPSVSSFLDSGTSVLTWLISTFSSILTFMIANPICFICLIGSLVGVAFIYIKSTIGT